MSESDEFARLGDSVRRFLSSLPELDHESVTAKIGPGREQIHVDSDQFGIDEANISDHCNVLRDHLPEMMESLAFGIKAHQGRKCLSLELPTGVSDARHVGPIRMVSAQSVGKWVTRFDVIFEVSKG